MRLSVKDSLLKKFDDEIVFFKGMIKSPDTVGSIIPTSRRMARIMAEQIDLSSGLPVLELGPGTGVITREILIHGVRPKNLYAVEYSKTFADRLCRSFPNVNLMNGDAFDLDHVLGPQKDVLFDTIITSMPLLNFPISMRTDLIRDLIKRIPKGRPVILFSYGMSAPVQSDGKTFEVSAVDWVLRNVPPARIWAYRAI